ncbi:radical SAM protein [Ancylomarina euxinus]|uniref:Radical SAM protein n=1 Tax=Ancylomarina euxinus TaxID=2283627 RepID=A0A425Y4C1_9BACT|nr:radical SAM protein [Ancylomarina euxinus]MCZ4694555.1 radical SAM protein [Ancylomarina euxinus]MUP14098.1 radical SAM protein [Ancylomarina euxinus]RRG22956.1 radical SAM protein [Ancylomarina euxinus]
MEASDIYDNILVNRNSLDFIEFPQIRWYNAYRDEQLISRRSDLLEFTKDSLLFKDTKPFYKQISKGCKLCGAGFWSCLFITGKCNANCFYCPTSQTHDDLPSTQGLSFESASAYAEYVNHFKFKGVGFSGGEPFLVFDRVIDFLKKLRKKCSPDLYVWLYTNGILVDEIKLKKLAALGLNEIRFDIGATDFSLDKVRMAKGIIENVTIEIPAIPEELERMKLLLPEMIKAGVSNLNLHQLRLTKYNAPKLLKRDYTYVADERPLVLESEIMALELIKYASDSHLEIGINYCSFNFKHRFQKAGFRSQIANALAEDSEIINSNGFVRNLNGHTLNYERITVTDFDHLNGLTLDLNHKKYSIKRDSIMKNTELTSTQLSDVETLISEGEEQIPKDEFLYHIWKMEHIENKLRKF